MSPVNLKKRFMSSVDFKKSLCCLQIVRKVHVVSHYSVSVIGVREAFLQGGLKVLALKMFYVALIRKSRLQMYNFQILQGQC
jgi:hypothetical protein